LNFWVFSFRDVTNIEVMCNIYIFNLNLKIFKNKYYGFSCGSEFLKYSQFLHVFIFIFNNLWIKYLCNFRDSLQSQETYIY
jgi:hypothetical protein